MIKTYYGFIKESKYEDIQSEYHSIGEYIEDVCKDDEYLLKIVSNYIKDFDTDIRISNAVNLLNEFDKKQLFYRVYNYLNNGEKEKEPDIMTNVIIDDYTVESIIAGKNIFRTFLKSLTALGLKNISKSTNPLDGFLLYYSSKSVDIYKIKMVFERFKSLSIFIDHIDYTFNEIEVYYGITTKMTFEYGIYTDKKLVIGEFKLNKSNLNWILLSESPSANSIKKDLIVNDMRSLSLFSKIANDFKLYPISSKSKSGPVLEGDIITFGFYGIGKWNNGVLDSDDLMNIKNKLKSWLMKFKWSDSILVNVSSDSFWVYFNIKIKR